MPSQAPERRPIRAGTRGPGVSAWANGSPLIEAACGAVPWRDGRRPVGDPTCIEMDEWIGHPRPKTAARCTPSPGRGRALPPRGSGTGLVLVDLGRAGERAEYAAGMMDR